MQEQAPEYFAGIGYEIQVDGESFVEEISLAGKEDWARLDEQLEAVKQKFYRAGVQEVVDDINKQLEQYRNS